MLAEHHRTKEAAENAVETNELTCPLDNSMHVRKTSEEDPYDVALKQTGCSELNDAVLECYYDNKDWRLCQPQVLAFKACFDAYQRSLAKESKN